MTIDIHMELLRKAADTLEQRFLSPIYLVGSFQRKYKGAHDIDIIMVVTIDRAKRLFDGEIHYNHKRFLFNRKQKLWIEQFVKDFDIDFKVQLEEEFKAHPQKEMAVKLGRYAAIPE